MLRSLKRVTSAAVLAAGLAAAPGFAGENPMRCVFAGLTLSPSGRILVADYDEL